MIFYVVYPEDKEIKICLNALKLLSDEKQRTQAHITVRGPYVHRLSDSFIKQKSEIIRDITLNIEDVSNFFDDNQSTVFFKCGNNIKLKEIWKKSSYKSFIPHITIYNGKNKIFAKKLYNILKSDFIPFSFKIDALDYLEPKEDNTLKLNYLNNIFDYNHFFHFLDEDIKLENIKKCKITEKLNYIEKVSKYLYSMHEK